MLRPACIASPLAHDHWLGVRTVTSVAPPPHYCWASVKTGTAAPAEPTACAPMLVPPAARRVPIAASTPTASGWITHSARRSSRRLPPH
ncbi:hypothetical protein BN2497_12291 [Janthinobacterium sp. CG23_2]|nr:hypothetical protein BN2497_12291 [Janthinobacterium sp. CG23_2]CUU32543.1 hypothetical protein BN3177_12291 [Janthinobacterium sp. CG23_2]